MNDFITKGIIRDFKPIDRKKVKMVAPTATNIAKAFKKKKK